MASVWTAARTGNLQALNMLLSSGHINVNARTSTAGQTLLHIAIESEKPQVVALLINVPGLNPNIKDNNGEAPLGIAAALGDIDSARTLLTMHNCNINIRNNYGKTPLHIAVENSHEEIIHELFDSAELEVNARDALGRTPIANAVMNYNTEMVKVLLTYMDVNPNIPSNDGNYPLELALEGIGLSAEISKELIEFSNTNVNLEINEYDETPIFQIIENRDNEMLKLILQREDLNINVKSKRKILGRNATPLYLAAHIHYNEGVRLLCADPRLEIDEFIINLAEEHLFSGTISDYILARAYHYFVERTYTNDTKVYDFIEADEIPLTSVSHDNLIFIYGTNYFTIPRATIMAQIASRENFYFECKSPSLSAPLYSQIEKKKYFNIQGIGNFIVPFISLQTALTGPVNVFNLNSTGEVLPYITNYMNVLGDPTTQTGLNGQEIDIASGDHCQEGTSKLVYELQNVHMIKSATGGAVIRSRRTVCRRRQRTRIVCKKHQGLRSRKHKKYKHRI